MRDSIRRRIEQADAVGGRLVSRLWGSLLLVALVVVGIPMTIATLWQGHWIGATVSGVVTIGGLLFVRYLFDRNRRLSDME